MVKTIIPQLKEAEADPEVLEALEVQEVQEATAVTDAKIKEIKTQIALLKSMSPSFTDALERMT